MKWEDFLEIGKTEFEKDKEFVNSRIDEIKREVRMRREDIDGLIININIEKRNHS